MSFALDYRKKHLLAPKKVEVPSPKAKATPKRRARKAPSKRVVAERREGTKRIYELAPRGLVELRAYFEQFWSQALDAYKEAAERKEGKR